MDTRDRHELEMIRVKRTESWWLGTSCVALFAMGAAIYNQLIRQYDSDTFYAQNMSIAALYLFFCGARQWALDEIESGQDFGYIFIAAIVWSIGGQANNIQSLAATFCAVPVSIGIIVSLFRFYKRQREPKG